MEGAARVVPFGEPPQGFQEPVRPTQPDFVGARALGCRVQGLSAWAWDGPLDPGRPQGAYSGLIG